MRRLLWVYIALVFLEGPLRKWLLPGMSDPLLVARDPIVIWMLFIAWKKRLFVGDRLIGFVGWLAFASVIASLIAGGSLFSTAYGIRTNFLHIPVALLMARFLDKNDLLLFAKLALACALPHGMLMMVQFFEPAHSFLNSGADDAFRQIGLGDGFIRPAGIFSYNTGASAYHAIVLALYLAPLGGRETRYSLLRLNGLVGTGMAAVFSGSRGAWLAYMIVVAVYLLGSVRFAPGQMLRKTPALIALMVFLPIILSIPSLATALNVFLEHRLVEGSTEGELIPRLVASLTQPFEQLWQFPLLGHGLGVGTNVGAKLAGVGSMFAYGDAEKELVRHIIESGAVLGGLLVLSRVAATARLLRLSLHSATSDISSLALCAAVAPGVLSGNLGNSTTAGFCVLGAGIVLLATRLAQETVSFPTPAASPLVAVKPLQAGAS